MFLPRQSLQEWNRRGGKAMDREKINSPREQKLLKRRNVFRFRFALLLFLLVGTGNALLIYPVDVALGTCSNGLVEKFEQCDDGNLNNGDGCSSLCQKEGDDFPVVVYTPSDPPPTPALEELPLASPGHLPIPNE
jgi:cysteine-rich repeat protein